MKLLHRTLPLLIILLIINTSKAQNNQAANNMVLFASGLNNPVCITNAGDNRLFVVDQAGYIRIVDSDGIVRTLPFLDIRDWVTFGGERGLLGLAFHPDYKTNGFFYVNYVGVSDITTISRFKVNSGNNDIKGTVLHEATTSEANYEFDPGKQTFGTYILHILIDGKKLTHKLVM